MAVVAPKRRSAAAPAPAPSRTTAPKRRKPAAPARTKPRQTAAAPARAKPRQAAAAPARAPQRPQPRRAAPQRAPRKGQPRLALAVGRTAATVRDLPDSGLIVRLTRGRAWIAVLGVLLVGIVALNVVTLSFAASLGKIDEQTSTLEAENSVLANRLAKRDATPRIHAEGVAAGLATAPLEGAAVIQASPDDAATAARRLAAAGG
ncbi:MAG: hypothetical protein U0R71_09905 [Solirubrobacterales bacterium]